jgi:aspartate racemase
MRLVGLIGGTSWVSTQEYYALLNRIVNERLGGQEFATCLIYSLNFGDVIRFNKTEDWASIERLQVQAAKSLKGGGAEALVLCANTMHMHAEAVGKATGLPVIHIVDAVAAEIRKQHLSKVALLGTRFTMEKAFFRDRLAGHGIASIIPCAEDRDFIHRTIFEELTKDVFTEETRRGYVEITDRLTAEGAEGVILGCTEIPLLMSQADVSIPAFDTTRIHAEAAVDFMLN